MTAIPLATLALTAAGTAYSVYSAEESRRASLDVAAANAETARRAATDAILRGQTEEELTRQRGARMIGAERAAIGAAGLEMTSGSPLQILTDTAGMTELDALTVRSNAAREAWGLQSQAAGMLAQGEVGALEARARGVGSLLGGTAQALAQYVQLKHLVS